MLQAHLARPQSAGQMASESFENPDVQQLGQADGIGVWAQPGGPADAGDEAICVVPLAQPQSGVDASAMLHPVQPHEVQVVEAPLGP